MSAWTPPATWSTDDSWEDGKNAPVSVVFSPSSQESSVLQVAGGVHAVFMDEASEV